MRTKIVILFALLGLASAMLAGIYLPFRGWEPLKQNSSDIAIMRCIRTQKQISYRDGMTMWEVEVVLALKGATNAGACRLTSLYRPRQDEYYLVFSNFDEGVYHAVEEYRIVPLGASFSTNMLIGKSLDEQIQHALQHRLNNLNREMEQVKQEMKRVEEGLERSEAHAPTKAPNVPNK